MFKACAAQALRSLGLRASGCRDFSEGFRVKGCGSLHNFCHFFGMLILAKSHVEGGWPKRGPCTGLMAITHAITLADRMKQPNILIINEIFSVSKPCQRFDVLINRTCCKRCGQHQPALCHEYGVTSLHVKDIDCSTFSGSRASDQCAAWGCAAAGLHLRAGLLRGYIGVI